MDIWLTTKKRTSGLRLNHIRCSIFGFRFSENKHRKSKTKHRKPEHRITKTEQRKWSSSLFRQGESPNGFSYWCNKAKAETHSLGFSDFYLPQGHYDAREIANF